MVSNNSSLSTNSSSSSNSPLPTNRINHTCHQYNSMASNRRLLLRRSPKNSKSISNRWRHLNKLSPTARDPRLFMVDINNLMDSSSSNSRDLPSCMSQCKCRLKAILFDLHLASYPSSHHTRDSRVFISRCPCLSSPCKASHTSNSRFNRKLWLQSVSQLELFPAPLRLTTRRRCRKLSSHRRPSQSPNNNNNSLNRSRRRSKKRCRNLNSPFLCLSNSLRLNSSLSSRSPCRNKSNSPCRRNN